LLNRQVVAVTNFPARRIADFDSEVLVLGAIEHGGRIVLLRPEAEAELGTRIG
jgi:tRNA-binding protein